MADSIVHVKLKYKDKLYEFDFNFKSHKDGTPYPFDSADYMFRDGNYSCDCNKSLFIQRYCDDKFPEMPCGDEIELISLWYKNSK